MKNVEIVAFDADDTLWVCEPYFREMEEHFCDLLSNYMPQEELMSEVFKTEIQNMRAYGYGVKAFTLSMIETALRISEGKVDAAIIRRVVDMGKSILNRPIELIEGVENVLDSLNGSYKLIMATKGDLLDQERKINTSGIKHYFSHIEIMSEKDIPNYERLFHRLNVNPSRFLMIGNSLKSDVIPVLELGGYGVHIPYHITWELEKVDGEVEHPQFSKIDKIEDVLSFLQ